MAPIILVSFEDSFEIEEILIRSFGGLGLQVYGWSGWGVQDVHEVFCCWQQRQGPPLGRMEGHRGGQETAQEDDGASKHCYQRLDINIWKCQPEIFSPGAIMFLSICTYLKFQTRSLSCWPTKLLTRVWWTRGGKGSALRNTSRSTTSSR